MNANTKNKTAYSDFIANANKQLAAIARANPFTLGSKIASLSERERNFYIEDKAGKNRWDLDYGYSMEACGETHKYGIVASLLVAEVISDEDTLSKRIAYDILEASQRFEEAVVLKKPVNDAGIAQIHIALVDAVKAAKAFLAKQDSFELEAA